MKTKVHWRLFFGLVVLGVLLGVAACGRGEESSDVTPTQEGSTPGSGVVGTPGPVPTLDPNIRLVRYDSPDKGYSIEYPEGWQVEAAGIGAPDIFVSRMEGSRKVAQVSVACTKGVGLTPDDLIEDNNRIIGGLGSVIDPTLASPVEVAGVTGKRGEYSTQVGAFAAEHVAVFFVVGECGWRIGLSIPVSAGDIDQFLPLFDRILASFRPSG
jgi:hypothetical protein